jgi:hypothetical protein
MSTVVHILQRQKVLEFCFCRDVHRSTTWNAASST